MVLLSMLLVVFAMLSNTNLGGTNFLQRMEAPQVVHPKIHSFVCNALRRVGV